MKSFLLCLLGLLGLTLPACASPTYFHSRPTATAKLYLDFDGDPASLWGGRQIPATPAYTGDSKAVWASVAQKFSPFNLDVTNEDPGNLDHKRVARVVIGNNTWAPGVGGISQVGGFSQTLLPNTGYVFPNVLSGSDHIVAEAAAHEAGHLFGLYHQSQYADDGTLLAKYNPGDSLHAPVMGNSYYAAEGNWWRGRSELFYGNIQDDLVSIASAVNGFGYAPDVSVVYVGGTTGYYLILNSPEPALLPAALLLCLLPRAKKTH